MSNRNSGIFQMQLPRVHIREALDHFKSICGRDHKGSMEGPLRGNVTCKRCIAERTRRMTGPGVRS